MCGIVGFIGNEDVKELLLVGLERLEYRGYDSSGISIITKEKEMLTFKDKGRIKHLRSLVKDVYAEIGIAHTRWATHGIPSYLNSHPHQTKDGRFSVVHNGVIENVNHLRKQYLREANLVSDTDTEVVAELISYFFKKTQNIEETIKTLLQVLEGSYAIVFIDRENSERIYAMKNKSPLLIGNGEDFQMIASDALAMIDKTNRFYQLQDLEYALLERTKIKICNAAGKVVERQPIFIEIDERDVGKGLYEHYMLKEIDEQAVVIRRIIESYRKEEELWIDPEIITSIKAADRIYIIAAGTSYHAGLIGRNLLESLLEKEVSVLIASEFNYHPPLLKGNPVFIFISQSGETADSRAALKEVTRRGYQSIALTNVKDSTLYRETTYQLLMHAGREIAVASTKAYTASITVLAILAHLASENREFPLLRELAKAAGIIELLIEQKASIKKFAEEYLQGKSHCFFIGRAVDYALALEAALKLKEISYIHAEGFAAGELKHGSIALIDQDTPVVVIISEKSVNLPTRANGKEVEARNGKTLYLSMQSVSEESDQLIVPDIHPLLAPLVMIVPLQLFAYYAAYLRGLDIDKPRNLAKSVTVE
jgi:glucosamine--fructose-6-phosphate aminotransferase (isomerizing)